MSVRIHRCRFLETDRAGVSAMAFNHVSLGPEQNLPANLRLAIGRANGDIEIWCTSPFFCEFVIPGARGRSVEDLCWVDQNRLFSVGATDTIVEWDVATGLPLQFVRSDAGVVWAISVNTDRSELAAATETGHIIIYDVKDGNLEFKRRLVGADTSLACVCWIGTNEVAAGGSDGCIHIWSVNQNRIVQTLRVDKQKSRNRTALDDTIVWTVKLLPKTQQLVSGDSNGFIKFWNMKTWSLHQNFQAHEGDVLCLATNYEGSALFSSGLDQKIVQTRLTDPNSRKFTIMNSIVAHTHDIRCMAAYQTGKTNFLVSGGLEPGFVVSSITEFTLQPHRRILPSRPAHIVQIADSGFVTEFKEQMIKVWRLVDGGRQLKAQVKISGEEFLTSVSFDPELGLLAAGSLYKLRLFFVDKNSVSIVPLPTWPQDQGCRLLAFAEPEKLVVVTDQDKLVLLDTNSGELVSIVSEAPRKFPDIWPYTNSISHLAVGHGLVAVARHNNTTDVYSILGKLVSTIPATNSRITALSIRNSKSLVVSLLDQNILEFDIKSGLLTPWSRLNMNRMPLELKNQSEPAQGIFCGVGGSDRIWIWGPSWLATVDLSSMSPLRKRKNADEDKDDENDEDNEAVVEEYTVVGTKDGLPTFWISTKYKPLFFAGALGSDLLVSELKEKSLETKKFWSNRRIQL